MEVSGGTALFFDFGSYHHEFHCADPDTYYKDVAKIIYGRMAQNESIRSKTFARQTYNWDNLYKMRYTPISVRNHPAIG